MDPTALTVTILILALAFSLFFGFKACQIFSVNDSGRPWSFKFHQFWFNFLGCLAGWAALLVLLRAHEAIPFKLEASDAVLALIAFVGMTGHLPMTVMGFIGTLGDATKKLLGLASKGEDKKSDDKKDGA